METKERFKGVARVGARHGWANGLSVGLALALFGVCLAPVDHARADGADGADGTADRVAASVQSFYEQTRGLEVEFSQSYYHRLYDEYDRSRGRVLFVKPGKMRWDYESPRGKLILSDGQRLTFFEPGPRRADSQCIQQPLNGSGLPDAFSFLTGEGRLEQNFRFRLLNSRRMGYENGYVLELRPIRPSSQYARVLFYVPKRDGRSTGVVKRVLIEDAAGNRNRFDFRRFKWNPDVSASRFRFQPPARVRCQGS